MPYTQEELQSLTWYQNLIDEDEQQYLKIKICYYSQAALSGSADNGSLLVRDEKQYDTSI